MATSQDPGKHASTKTERAGGDLLAPCELEKAAERFEKAAQEAEEEDGEGETMEGSRRVPCLLRAGACRVAAGQFEKALPLLESAASSVAADEEAAHAHTNSEGYSSETQALSTAQSDLNTRADVFVNLAAALEGLGDHARARKDFQTAVTLYEKAGYEQQAAAALAGMGRCYRASGEREEEVGALSQAQGLFRKVNDHNSEARVCVDLAKAYLTLDREEKCKQSVARAKLISFRLEDQAIKGRLYLEFGLIYCSLCQFTEALLNFERALPLVRGSDKSSPAQQQLEASILQNIGAAYNEERKYSESIVYHAEAAELHSKLSNPTSEAKCLCNLALARSQLEDYSTAANTFNRAFTAAGVAHSPQLQFQALEGLATCHYHKQQYSEAVSSFTSALEVLDQLETGDTGIARERVKEKLSDATEALEATAEQLQPDLSAVASDNERNLPPPCPSHDHSNGQYHQQNVQSTNRVEEEDEGGEEDRAREGEDAGEEEEGVEQKGEEEEEEAELHPPRPDNLQTAVEDNVSGHRPHSNDDTQNHVLPIKQHKKGNVKTSKGKGKKNSITSHHKLPSQYPTSISITTQDSYDTDIRAYERTLISSSLSSSDEEPAAHPSLPSPHAPNSQSLSDRATQLSAAIASSKPQSHRIMTQGSLRNPPHIQEGSLAIGPNARQYYTTRCSNTPGRKGRAQTEIVPLEPEASSTADLQESHKTSRERSQRNMETRNRSTVCTVL